MSDNRTRHIQRFPHRVEQRFSGRNQRQRQQQRHKMRQEQGNNRNSRADEKTESYLRLLKLVKVIISFLFTFYSNWFYRL